MAQTFELHIESLDHEARGVAHLDGKVVFVEGALPGEHVTAQLIKKKPKFNTARATDIHKTSWLRVEPKCPHFGVCGGCAMQHLTPDAQVAVKQRVLEDAFKHLADLKPEQMLAPIHGPAWGYRYRARLTARLVPRKGGVLVGFHERRSSYVADMSSCSVLPSKVSDLLVPLRRLIESMSTPDRLPQIEVAVGDSVTALVLRHLEPLKDTDKELLRVFAQKHGVQWWLQPKGPDTVHLLDEAGSAQLAYSLPTFDVRMPFKPTDFTQVNHQINRVLVSKALTLLDVQPTERVLDLFCGLGNFTLPIARLARSVLGIEGSEVLVQRALENAIANGIDNAAFEARNLFEFTLEDLNALPAFDRMLIDPPREGALAVCEALVGQPDASRPKRIVYVSCNPATLARDAAVLCHRGPYRLRQAGVINMFPHTGHVESIAVFEPTKSTD
ncbi:MAG: 23S rRNA (uracil(1939)-C(5))-methyltransferase RlmD [Burkholderiaceae bacterium]|nr:23S rRNA (uracil(1939)-C(5))-methyltransferase RlmD [Burkholderiaceae bacterium]MCD8516786.1 23S rRNA (uracil(1939)-C(5))-methyltransferase RlmD [Burkholderiaceae bacterium]MCD8564385.1 23S rRNA (uracil(1939)-C(5))-methyltransferase RlmD [Burkholderiaceae bacterium]